MFIHIIVTPSVFTSFIFTQLLFPMPIFTSLHSYSLCPYSLGPYFQCIFTQPTLTQPCFFNMYSLIQYKVPDVQSAKMSSFVHEIKSGMETECGIERQWPIPIQDLATSKSTLSTMVTLKLSHLPRWHFASSSTHHTEPYSNRSVPPCLPLCQGCLRKQFLSDWQALTALCRPGLKTFSTHFLERRSFEWLSKAQREV